MTAPLAPTIPRLHLIGPLGVVAADMFREVALAAVRGGCDAVHLRLPGARTSELLPLARALRRALEGTVLFINDRPDIALVTVFDGIQLPEVGFTSSEARGIAGSHLMIGRSVHSTADARSVRDDGADFLLAGHVFDTDSKAGTPGRGLAWLSDITAETTVPVIAIGGITVDRIPSVLDTGAHGIALGRELLLANDPEQVARSARLAIDIFIERKAAHAAG